MYDCNGAATMTVGDKVRVACRQPKIISVMSVRLVCGSVELLRAMATPPRGAIVATHSPDGPREFWLCRVDGAAARGRLQATWLERKGSTGATYELGGAQQGGIEQSSVVCEVERGWTGGGTFRLTTAHRRAIYAALNSAEDAAG